MTRRKSLKGNRAAQRNYEHKALKERGRTHMIHTPKNAYNRSDLKQVDKEIEDEVDCEADDCMWPDCECPWIVPPDWVRW
jgi:hypothetical protein